MEEATLFHFSSHSTLSLLATVRRQASATPFVRRGWALSRFHRLERVVDHTVCPLFPLPLCPSILCRFSKLGRKIRLGFAGRGAEMPLLLLYHWQKQTH